MYLLLAVIYVVFISLGLPDSLFGTAWPIMHLDFNVDESFASVYMIITAIGSGSMSFFAGPLIRKFGTGKVTIFSILLTAVGMVIVGLAPHIAVAMAGSVVMGLGAGAIDSALNSYVAVHYKAIHMNLLHAFWGVGVTISPLIMSAFLDAGNNWQGGYLCVAAIQFGIFILALCSVPLWKKYDIKKPQISEVKITEITQKDTQNTQKRKPAIFAIVKKKGVLLSFLTLGLYVSMEYLIGTWGASYAVNVKELTAAVAAKWVALYYGGIMIGRVMSGFISLKVSDNNLIRSGTVIMLAGMVVFALPIGEMSLVGLLLIGIGFGPVFPSTIHAVPFRFGEEYAADITGITMGTSYALGWACQLTFGYVATATTFAFLPYLLIGITVIMFVVSEVMNYKIKVVAK